MSKWLLPLAALLFISGCGAQKVLIGGNARPVMYHTCVSISPGAYELAMTKYAMQVLGRTESDDFPPNTNKDIPVVMKGIKPNYEMIAKLKPDVVVYDPQLFSQADIDQFKTLGIPTMALGGDTVQDYITSVYKGAGMTAAETTTSDYVDDIIKAEQQGAAIPEANRGKVALLMADSSGEDMICGTDGFLADAVRQAGGNPSGPKDKGFVKLNPEDLISENPDVIVVAGKGDPVLNDSRFKDVAAVKRGNVFGFNPDILLRKGGRVDLLISHLVRACRQAQKGQ